MLWHYNEANVDNDDMIKWMEKVWESLGNVFDKNNIYLQQFKLLDLGGQIKNQQDFHAYFIITHFSKQIIPMFALFK